MQDDGDDDDGFDSLHDLVMEFRAEQKVANEKVSSEQPARQVEPECVQFSVPDTLEILMTMLRKAGDVERHISSLRDVGMYLLEEADKLEAREPVNFHVSHHIH